MNNWRLVVDVVAYIPICKQEIYFSIPDKKSYQLAVTKYIDGYYNEIHIDENEFELKICNTGREDENDDILFVRSPHFPEPSSWYQIRNYGGNIISLLSQLNCEKGYFKDYKFKAVFDENKPSDVAFCCEEMSEYKGCISEMSRRVNCELYKKTKVWVPGHRYDTIKETVYYLAKVNTRRKEPGYSEYLEDPKVCPEVYLTVSELEDTDKSVSDILKTRSIGSGPKDIHVLYKMSMMVDSGEALKDDFSKYEEYIPSLLKNAITRCEEKSEFGYIKYTDQKSIFEPFAYFTDSEVSYEDIKCKDSEDSVIDLVSEVTSKMLLDCVINCWNFPKYRNDFNIGSDKSFDENRKALSLLFPSVIIRDENSLKYAYYSGLFKRLRLDYDTIIDNVLINWDENKVVYDNFDDFLKYLPYTKLRKQSDLSIQRVKSTRYKLDLVKISDLYGDGELTESLIELINFSKDGFGAGVSQFNIVNIGSRKEPVEFIEMIITIEDLVRFKSKKGELDMPESLKLEILKNRFCSLNISFDRAGEIN